MKKMNTEHILTDFFLFSKKISKHCFRFGSNVSHNCKTESMA